MLEISRDFPCVLTSHDIPHCCLSVLIIHTVVYKIVTRSRSNSYTHPVTQGYWTSISYLLVTNFELFLQQKCVNAVYVDVLKR